MEAAAAVACRGGGLLARARPGHGARRHGVGAGAGARPVARQRLLVVASLGETPSAPSRSAVAVAQEVICSETLVPVTRAGGDDEVDVASTAILPPPDVDLPSPDHAGTVRVKFVLEKRCAFGQRFLVVGDDPALGLWDPAKATALDWSEGHVWTAKTDLPANRLVEFKFLLQDPSGHVRWQHGGNRTLQVTEVANTLVVYEDWDYAVRQQVSEEVVDPSVVEHEPIFAVGNGVLLADDDQIDEDQETYKGFLHAEKSPAAAEASLHAKTMGVNGTNRPQKDEKDPEGLRRRASMAAQNGSLASAGINGDAIILYKEAAPVANRPASMFENDMVWIRNALQGMLQNLGFHIGTTKT
ncbi:hypothetical protein ZWY2020_030880 [Hordeum vulgare]|nr:hypothetical protein ZWY2020_030880 [Hordeum vulgare]